MLAAKAYTGVISENMKIWVVFLARSVWVHNNKARAMILKQ